MKNLLFILLFILPLRTLAQKETVIEPALIECRYHHIVIQDTVNHTSMKDLMVLRIGKNVSQFYSDYTRYSDSIWTDPNGRKIAFRQRMEAIRTKNFENNPGTRTKEYLYKSNPRPGITSTYAIQGENDYAFIYFEEETPRQTWKIQDSTKQVLNYTCQLAVTQFRGRTWYAWFTTDIPIDNGPWKLGGLPGLIVEAYDSQEHYHYTLTDIRTKNLQPITFYNYWQWESEKTTRLDYLKMEHKIHKKHFKSYAYDFQELDYHRQ